MPGLLRGVARTAVVAGTATAVSGRVPPPAGTVGRQEQEQQAARPTGPRTGASVRSETPPAAPSTDDKLAQLKQLGELRDAGVLTDAEFEARRARSSTAPTLGRRGLPLPGWSDAVPTALVDHTAGQLRCPAAERHLSPPGPASSSTDPASVVELVVEVDGGVDQGQVGERLGEVAELLAGEPDLLGVQARGGWRR